MLSIEIGRLVVDPIEDLPNLGRSIDLHSSIELSVAICSVSVVAGRMGRHIDAAMKSHTHRRTDALRCKSFCMFGIARDHLHLS